MKGEFIDSFANNFESGLKELSINGVVYKNTNHFHSNTTTAAGHATIATGKYPSKNGIVGNDVYNRNTNKWEYSILDTSIRFVGLENCTLEKVSAKNLIGLSIGDWQKNSDTNAQVYSVALKDKSAILMGGKNADRAFWFDGQSTQMVSSNYYKQPFPEWAKEFNGKSVMAKEIAEGWNLSADLQPNTTTTGDSIPTENGRFYPWFPHNLTTFNPDLVKNDLEGNFLWRSPYGDQFVLKFSEQLILNNKLGKDKHCDVLTIGLSSADYIGHQFGPNSLETLDYYNKMDNFLGDYIAFLDKNVGRNKYLLVLTSDHGVAQLPEVATSQGKDAKRILRETFKNDMAFIDKGLQSIYGLNKSTFKEVSGSGIEPNFDYLNENAIDSSEYIIQLISHLKSLTYIAEAYSEFDIKDSACPKMYIEEVRNSYYPNKNPFVYLLAKPNYLIDYGANGTSHGTPYTYDTHVPLIFYGNKKKPRINNNAVNTVDIAPTILYILGIKPTEKLDGKVLLD